jgi:hypothetical protein
MSATTTMTSTTATIHTQLSPFDLIPPKVYIKFIIYLPLKPGVGFQPVFEKLQAGLRSRFLAAKSFFGLKMNKVGDQVSSKSSIVHE